MSEATENELSAPSSGWTRGFAVDEVKRTNGQVSLEDAVQHQRCIEPDDEWPDVY